MANIASYDAITSDPEAMEFCWDQPRPRDSSEGRACVVFAPPVSGASLSVDGGYPAGPIVVFEQNSADDPITRTEIFSGRVKVEVIRRLSALDTPMFGLRLRDPAAGTRPDNGWISASRAVRKPRRARRRTERSASRVPWHQPHRSVRPPSDR